MEFNILLFSRQQSGVRHCCPDHQEAGVHKVPCLHVCPLIGRARTAHREYYGTDRRTIHLKLTDAAAPMVSDGKNVQKRAAEIICRGFTPEEHRMLFELMNRINSNISDYRKEGKLHEQQ